MPKKLNEEDRKEHRRQIQKRWNAKESSKAAKRAYYQANREQILSRNNQKKKQRKISVMVHYSQNPPTCRLCGISDIDVLNIDHMEGGGAKHKILLGSLGSKLYFWLEKNNYPVGYQVLCFNCNFKKSLHG